jgi:ATP-binding cassette subfamily F protein 3
LLKEAQRLEREMEQWQRDRRELEIRLADPALYAADAHENVPDIMRRQGELMHLLAEAEERWLEVHAELEEIGEVCPPAKSVVS